MKLKRLLVNLSLNSDVNQRNICKRGHTNTAVCVFIDKSLVLIFMFASNVQTIVLLINIFIFLFISISSYSLRHGQVLLLLEIVHGTVEKFYVRSMCVRA